MYHKAAAGTGTAGGGVLASTGGGNTIWMIIAMITLIAAGAAIWRIVPRKQ
jgi:LPXTG-motif cell wall-anchored protein